MPKGTRIDREDFAVMVKVAILESKNLRLTTAELSSQLDGEYTETTLHRLLDELEELGHLKKTRDGRNKIWSIPDSENVPDPKEPVPVQTVKIHSATEAMAYTTGVVNRGGKNGKYPGPTIRVFTEPIVHKDVCTAELRPYSGAWYPLTTNLGDFDIILVRDFDALPEGNVQLFKDTAEIKLQHRDPKTGQTKETRIPVEKGVSVVLIKSAVQE